MAVVEKQAYAMSACRGKPPLGAFWRLCRALVVLNIILFPLLGWVQMALFGGLSDLFEPAVGLIAVFALVPFTYFLAGAFFVGIGSLFVNRLENYTTLSGVAGKFLLMAYLVPLGLVGVWALIVLVFIVLYIPAVLPDGVTRLIVDNGSLIVVLALSIPMYFRFAMVARSDEVCLIGEVFSLGAIVATVVVPHILFGGPIPDELMLVFCFGLSIPIVTFVIGSLKRYGRSRYFFGNDINAEGVFWIPDVRYPGLMVAVPTDWFMVLDTDGVVRRGSIVRNAIIFFSRK